MPKIPSRSLVSSSFSLVNFPNFTGTNIVRVYDSQTSFSSRLPRWNEYPNDAKLSHRLLRSMMHTRTHLRRWIALEIQRLCETLPILLFMVARPFRIRISTLETPSKDTCSYIYTLKPSRLSSRKSPFAGTRLSILWRSKSLEIAWYLSGDGGLICFLFLFFFILI